MLARAFAFAMFTTALFVGPASAETEQSNVVVNPAHLSYTSQYGY